jgi:outer membrane assembly lipoprotein YfgL
MMMTMTKRPLDLLRGAALAAAVALLGACASSEKPKPTPLEPLASARLPVQVAWRHELSRPLAGGTVAFVGGQLWIGAENGRVTVLDAASGREQSRFDAGDDLTAGVGSDGRRGAVVTVKNELVVFEGSKVLWRKRLTAPVVTAPLVAGERVFVQSTDRVVEAYDLLDGSKLWVFSRSGDPLALAQRGVLMPHQDTLLVGNAARLVGLDPLNGQVRFEVSLATPRGTNEVERLADLVGPAARVGDVVCARSFQAAVSCVNVSSQRLQWSRNFGGFEGVGADADLVVAADGGDRLSAWRTASGDSVWTSERLRFRGLASPVVIDKAVVFGDAEGYVHFLSRERGELLQRLPTDGGAIIAPLVKAGGTVIALTRKGGVYALRAQ